MLRGLKYYSKIKKANSFLRQFVVSETPEMLDGFSLLGASMYYLI